MTSDFSDLVKITWDVTQPEKQIEGLIDKIKGIDATLFSVGKTAGQMFEKYSAGAEAAAARVTLWARALETVLSLQQEINKLPQKAPLTPSPGVTTPVTPATSATWAARAQAKGAEVVGPYAFYPGGSVRMEGMSQGVAVASLPPELQAIQERMKQARRLQDLGVEGFGGGAGGYLQQDLSARLTRFPVTTPGIQWYPQQWAQTQLPLPGTGLLPFYPQAEPLGRAQLRLPFQAPAPIEFPNARQDYFSFRTGEFVDTAETMQARRLAEAQADIQDEINAALEEQRVKARMLSIRQQDYGQYYNISQLSRPDMLGVLRTQAQPEWQMLQEQAQRYGTYDQWAAEQRWYAGIPQAQILGTPGQRARGVTHPLADLRTQVTQQQFEEQMAQLRQGARAEQLLGQPIPLAGIPKELVNDVMSRNLELARQKAAGLREEFMRTQSPEALAGWRSAQGEVNNLTQAMERSGSTLDRSAGQWARHIKWIMQGIVVWESLRLAMAAANEVLQEAIRVQDLQGRLAAIGNVPPGTAASQFAQAAQYGVAPAEAVPGIISAAQLRPTPAQQVQARQLAQFSGDAKQYANILQELIQTQARADAAGVKHVDTLGFIATAYSNIPGSMETYFDALQQGIVLSHSFGLTAEETGLALAKMAFDTEQSAENISTMFERMALRLQDPKVLEKLKGFGISGTTPQEVFPQVAAVTQRLIDRGEVERVQDLMMALTGGIQAGRQLRDMVTLFRDLNIALVNSGRPMDDFATKLARIQGTPTAQFDHLVASIKAYIAAVADANAQPTTFLERLFVLARGGPPGLALMFQGVREAAGGTAGMIDVANLQKQFEQQTGKPYLVEGGTVPQLNPRVGNPQINTPVPVTIVNPEFYEWLKRQAGTATQADVASKVLEDKTFALPRKGALAGPTPLELGGFSNLPAGISYQQFVEEVRKQELLLRSQVPDYTLARTKEAFYVEDEKRYRTTIGDPQAIRRALEVLQATGGGFGGFLSLPKGGTFEQFQALVTKYEAQLATAPGYRLDRKTYDYYDETLGVWRTIRADSEAIRRANEEQNKLLNQITGVFNVPVGGEVLVAFAALQAGFVPSNQLPGAGGGATEAGMTAAVGSLDWHLKNLLGTSERGPLPGGRDLPREHVPGKGEIPPVTTETYRRDELERIKDMTSTTAGAIARRDQLERAKDFQRDLPVKPGSPPPQPVAQIQTHLTVNLRNQVILDGKLILDTLMTRLNAGLYRTGRGSSGSKTNVLSV